MSDDEPGVPGEQIERQLSGLMGQFGAMVAESTREPRYRYEVVPWGRVNELAAEGWHLQAADIHLSKFLMARKLSAADEAVRILTEQEQST